MSPRIRITPVSVTSFASATGDDLKVKAKTNSTSHRGHLTVLPTRLESPRSLWPEGHTAVTLLLTGFNILISPECCAVLCTVLFAFRRGLP